MSLNITPAVTALKRWMESTGAKPAQIAAAVGKSHAAVYGWIKGDYRPDGDVRLKLERFTAGVVRVDAWLTKQERHEQENVQPFIADTKSASGE